MEFYCNSKSLLTSILLLLFYRYRIFPCPEELRAVEFMGMTVLTSQWWEAKWKIYHLRIGYGENVKVGYTALPTLQ